EAHDSQVILTVSAMRFRVNEEAVDRFVQKIWPRIRAAAPQARFRIVGSQMTEAHRARWGAHAGVEVIGFVERLADAYGACALTVAPIFEGGGTKIKVLESLLYGRTCVVAPHAQRGYEHVLRHGES